MRKVKIIGEISHESYRDFSDEMDELEKSKKPIEIELCSGGGDTYAGLAFYARITQSPCKTIIRAYGNVMSAATVILIAGTTRYMHKDAWFMVHDEGLKVREPNQIRSNSEFNHHETVEHQWAEILNRHSKISQAQWRELSKNTTYYTAMQCMSLGIVDYILGGYKC